METEEKLKQHLQKESVKCVLPLKAKPKLRSAESSCLEHLE